jgi:hypothetical protein
MLRFLKYRGFWAHSMFSFGLVLCLGSLLLLGAPSLIVGLACFLVGALLYVTMPVSAVFRRFSDSDWSF